MTPEIYEVSIHGVMKEIALRDGIIRQMRLWTKDPLRGSRYTTKYIINEGPMVMKEIQKLKLIKIELIYLYELSKLKAA